VGIVYLWSKAVWMKYYVIAGEASGDLHGANLLKELAQADTKSNVRAWGGDRMQAQGATIVKHYRELAFMGFWEVAKNIRTIFKNIKKCKEDIRTFKPDALVLIDYPGFNLRIATWAKQQGIPVHYYISPQVWAWKENRVKLMAKIIDYLYVILPFEKTFFEQKHQMPVDFVGHPLLDEIHQFEAGEEVDFRNEHGLPKDKPIVALLPGSRAQEVRKMMDVMLSTAAAFPDCCFAVAAAPHLDDTLFEELPVYVVRNNTYKLLAHAKAALVTSGTATLETALFEVPQVVCYKTSALSYAIGKQVVKLPYISLVNLILNAGAVPERIQGECHPDQLKKDLEALLHGVERTAQINAYKKLKKALGGYGASKKTAKLISQRTGTDA
jgi:lipid-A-disaccharide synthase